MPDSEWASRLVSSTHHTRTDNQLHRMKSLCRRSPTGNSRNRRGSRRHQPTGRTQWRRWGREWAASRARAEAKVTQASCTRRTGAGSRGRGCSAGATRQAEQHWLSGQAPTSGPHSWAAATAARHTKIPTRAVRDMETGRGVPGFDLCDKVETDETILKPSRANCQVDTA